MQGCELQILPGVVSPGVAVEFCVRDTAHAERSLKRVPADSRVCELCLGVERVYVPLTSLPRAFAGHYCVFRLRRHLRI
jgi:hypothetical protein